MTTIIWEEFLKIIKQEAGSQIVETWFKAVSLQDWDPVSKQVILKSPNQFVMKWIKEHYLELLKTHLARLLHTTEIKIFFTCKEVSGTINQKNIIPAAVVQSGQISLMEKKESAPTSSMLPSRRPTSSLTVQERTSKRKRINNINPAYQFSSFVVGPSNSLAHAAAIAICENLGSVYNPLFIYGGTGLGKTHLLHAIGNQARKHNSDIVVRYETSDQFINDFINSIRFDRSDQFRNTYQNIDVLMLDDIQFLSNKEQTQEMFFHIFNILYEQKKQIVLSSDTFPKEIKGLQSRIKSRMEWGLVADIQTPDLETKIAILKKKGESNDIELDDDVADFIASRVMSNIRELEGALIRVSAFAALVNKPISLEMARKVLLNLNDGRKKEGVLLDNILRTVAKHYSVSINDIKSKKRHKDIAAARQTAFYMMKKLSYCSLQSIGSFIGGRDHSTVIHAIHKIEASIKKDDHFEKKLKAIEQKIMLH